MEYCQIFLLQDSRKKLDNLSPVAIQPQLPQIGNEVFLEDFVLWQNFG